MAKSSKHFLPLLIVVTCGVIFLGDVPHKILPLAQAQVKNFSPEQVNKLARNESVEIEILDGVVHNARQIIEQGTEIIFFCARDGYEVYPPTNPNTTDIKIPKTLGHVVKVFDFFSGELKKKLQLYYDDSNPRPIILPRGKYRYTIDNNGNEDYVITVKGV